MHFANQNQSKQLNLWILIKWQIVIGWAKKKKKRVKLPPKHIFIFIWMCVTLIHMHRSCVCHGMTIVEWDKHCWILIHVQGKQEALYTPFNYIHTLFFFLTRNYWLKVEKHVISHTRSHYSFTSNTYAQSTRIHTQ